MKEKIEKSMLKLQNYILKNNPERKMPPKEQHLLGAFVCFIFLIIIIIYQKLND